MSGTLPFGFGPSPGDLPPPDVGSPDITALLARLLRNPVGTESTQSVGPATPIDPIANMGRDNTPIMQSDLARAHQQIQQAYQTAPTMVLGMTGGGRPQLPFGAPGIRAFHGSPYDFEQFDTSRIGTGEGAQAYGHGLYFAGNEGVAQSYRDALAGPPPNSGVHVDGVPAEDAGLSSSAIALAKMHLDGFQTLDNLRTSNEASLQRAQGILQRMPNSSIGIANRDMANRTLDALDELKGRELSFQQPQQPGKMYEVNLGADPEQFLHWDKPLSEQSPQVQTSLQGLNLPRDPGLAPTDTGSAILQKVHYANYDPVTGAPLQNTSRAEDQLQAAGIPGIKYLDQGSRQVHVLRQLNDQTGETTGWNVMRDVGRPVSTHSTEAEARAEADKIRSSNYVVFDANTIDILRKYGIAGLGLGLGGAVAGSQNRPNQ